MNILNKFWEKLKRLLKKMCDAYLEYNKKYTYQHLNNL